MAFVTAINAGATGSKETKTIKDPNAEVAANRVTAWQSTPDNTHYPSEKLVKDSIDPKTNNTDIAAAYSSSSTYALGALVIYNNDLYKCTTAITTAEVWTAAHWTAVTIGEALSLHSSQIEELETDKAEKTALALTDKKLDYLAALTKGQAWSESTGTTPAYQHTVAKGAKAVEVKKFGGKTIKYNQLVQNGNFSSTANWSSTNSTISVENNIITLSIAIAAEASYPATMAIRQNNINYTLGHKYYIGFAANTSASTGIKCSMNYNSINDNDAFRVQSVVGEYVTCESIFTRTVSNVGIRIGALNCYEGDTMMVKNVICVDLTDMFGSGNEPSTVAEFKAMFPSDYYPYSASTLLSADVTAVTSKEDDGTTTMGTLSIPSAVRALEGYGESNTADATQYNYVDFTNKKYIEVGHYVDGVWTAHAQEIDISSYIGDDNLLDVEYNGTLTFTQANTVSSTSVDVRIPVPNSTTYMINNAEATA